MYTYIMYGDSDNDGTSTTRQNVVCVNVYRAQSRMCIWARTLIRPQKREAKKKKP